MSDHIVRMSLRAKVASGLIEVRVLDAETQTHVAAYPAVEVSVSPDDGKVFIVIGDRRSSHFGLG